MTLQDFVLKVSAQVFDRRRLWLVLFALATLFFAWSATRLSVDAGFNKMVPLKHEYMKVYREYEKVFGGANRVAIALVQAQGDIFDREYMAKLKALTDDVFLLNGVDRPTVKSLFTPNTRFIEVIEEGFAGGNVIPPGFQGTDEQLKVVRANIEKSTEIGRSVANDFTGALVSAGLLEIDPQTGAKLDYFKVAAKLEELREKYSSDKHTVHIIGFAKAVGDIRDGTRMVVLFFGLAFLITIALMYWFLKAINLVLVSIAVALLPVLWLLGTLPLLGFGIDPLSILVPFLIFSIGVSHAVQMARSWERDVVGGTDGATAARRAFAKLFIPGTLALLTNVVGFAVIMLIPIDIVRELGITASLGVGWMILTNKVLLPLLLWSVTLDRRAAQKEKDQERWMAELWKTASRCVEPRLAKVILTISGVVLALGLYQAHNLKIGDYGIGVPELRANARYNVDSAKILEKFSIGVNTLGIVAHTTGVQGACTNYDIMTAIERFDWYMQNVPGTQSTISLPALAKMVNAGFNEGSVRWRQLPRDPQVMAQSVTPIDTSTGLLNPDCSDMQVLINTTDQQGRHDRRARRGGEGVHEREQDRQARAQARDGERRRHGGHERGRGQGALGNELRDLRRAAPHVHGDVPQPARHALHPDPARDRFHPVRGADAHAGDRPQDLDAAGDRTRRGRGRRLRHLPLQPSRGAPEGRQAPRPCLPGGARRARAGDHLHRDHDDDRRGDLGLFGPQAPGGHGRAPRLHVLPQHGRRALRAPGARDLHAQARGLQDPAQGSCPGRHDHRRQALGRGEPRHHHHYREDVAQRIDEALRKYRAEQEAKDGEAKDKK
jgi:predicted RND superfamily exporter protein